MKHSMFILGLVVVCVMGGCKKEQVQTENAAFAMYERYADNSHGVTVAYLGDFKVDNQPINAVMLSAPSEAEWQWLCDEFGVRECKNSPDAGLGAPIRRAPRSNRHRPKAAQRYACFLSL